MTDPKRSRDERVFLAAAVAAAVLALISPALIRGEGFLPVGSLWRVPPWNRVLAPSGGNGLLIDQLLAFWPWRLFLRGELLSGRFPFWNPWIAGGVPFAACVQAAPFFPTNLLLILLGPAAWSVVVAFLKSFVGGLFAALHARRIGAGRSGASLAGISFALGGFLVAWQGAPHANAACLLPVLFWALGRAFDRPGCREWILVAPVVGLIFLSGHPPTELQVLAAGAAYAVFRARRAAKGERLAAGLPALWSLLLGAALAAPALLPFLEYLPLSSTAASSAALARWGARLSPWAVLHLLMPLASGSPAHGAEALAAAFGLGPETNFLERAGWTGLVALVFAGFAWRNKSKEPEVRFHALLAVVGLAAALGVPPLPWIWKILPGFSSANPTRLLLMYSFGVSVLAGLGLEDDGAPADRRFVIGAIALFGLALFVDLLMVGVAWPGLTPGEHGFALGQAVAFAIEGAAAAALLLSPKSRRWGPLVAAAFLLRVDLAVNPTAPERLLYPPTEATRALAAEQGEGRVFALDAELAPDAGMPLGLHDARGRDFATPRRYEELVTGRAGDFDFYSNAPSLPPSPELLAISAVAGTPRSAPPPPTWTQVYEGEARVWRAPAPGKRALFVPRALYAAPARVLSAVRAPGFVPSSLIWLDDWETPPSLGSSKGTASIVSETPDEVVVRVESDGPGWLLLLDNWYPGWRVEVNGTLASLRRADHAFRAVEVPGGGATVRFSFVPYSFWIGVLIAALAAAALVRAWRAAPAN